VATAATITTTGYRLRIMRVSDLPVHTTYDGRTFEFQLGVTLYDEAYGTFYGNTVSEGNVQSPLFSRSQVTGNLCAGNLCARSDLPPWGVP
jgi:hypothetical protein